MKSKWKVTSNYIDGRTMYGVFRILDVGAVDHSGNRENFGGYVDTREEAASIVDRLNAEADDGE